jgi:hypothetical protein
MASDRREQCFLDDAEQQGRIEEARLLLRRVAAARRFLIEPEQRVYNDTDLTLSWAEERFAEVVRVRRVESLFRDSWLEYQDEEWKEGWKQARTEEARWLLHKLLAARSFDVALEIRARIDDEVDRGRLESWIMAAVSAAAIGEVFESLASAPARGVSVSALA